MSSEPNLLETTDFERRLLEAAGAERPSPELSARMAGALGLPPSAGTASLPAAKLASGWLSLGVVAALLGSAGVGTWALLRAPAEVTAPTRVSEPNPAGVASDYSPSRVIHAAPAVAATTATTATASAAGAPAASAATAALSPKRTKAPAEPGAGAERGDLREEIRAIDAVRSALAARAPAQALSLLQKYAGNFPNGTFLQEAAVLRIEALEQSGQRQKAQALSRDFRSKHPNSPLSERLERLSGSRD